jgi:hypothetical protein
MLMKKSTDTIGNRTRNLPVGSQGCNWDKYKGWYRFLLIRISDININLVPGKDKVRHPCFGLTLTRTRAPWRKGGGEDTRKGQLWALWKPSFTRVVIAVYGVRATQWHFVVPRPRSTETTVRFLFWIYAIRNRVTKCEGGNVTRLVFGR